MALIVIACACLSRHQFVRLKKSPTDFVNHWSLPRLGLYSKTTSQPDISVLDGYRAGNLMEWQVSSDAGGFEG